MKDAKITNSTLMTMKCLYTKKICLLCVANAKHTYTLLKSALMTTSMGLKNSNKNVIAKQFLFLVVMLLYFDSCPTTTTIP